MEKAVLKLAFFILMSFPLFGGGQFKARVDFQLGTGFDVVSNRLRGSFLKKNGGYYARRLRVSVKHMTTNNESRDHHMKERFGRHKRIVIENARGKNGRGSALVKMNGIEKMESFSYEKKDKKLHVFLQLKMSDYGLKGISYKDIVLEDKLKIWGEVDIDEGL